MQFLRSFCFVLLELLAVVFSLNAAEKESVRVCYLGKTTLYKLDLQLSLSQLRKEQKFNKDQLFQKDDAEIPLQSEEDWKINEICPKEKYYLVLKPANTFQIGCGEVTRKIKLDSLASDPTYQLQQTSLSNEASINSETYTNTTQKIDEYIDLSQDLRNRLFEKLNLVRAFNITTKTDDLLDRYQVIQTSFRKSIFWSGEPEWLTPDSGLRVEKLMSVSKTQHELRKLGITNVKAIAGLFGIEGEVQYKNSAEKLNQSKNSHIYFLVIYNVPKIKLSISKNLIQLEEKFLTDVTSIVGNDILFSDLITVAQVETFPEIHEIGKIYYNKEWQYQVKFNSSPVQTGTIPSATSDNGIRYNVLTNIQNGEGESSKNRYRKLLQVLEEYGFFVPTEFVLGGQIYAEDIKKETSSDDKEKEQDLLAGTLAISIQSPFPIMFESGIGQTSLDSTSGSHLKASHAVFKQVRGGDAASVNDTAKWISSLGSYNSWAVIKRDNLIPIIAFLEPQKLRRQCVNLINREKDNIKPSGYVIDMKQYISDIEIGD